MQNKYLKQLTTDDIQAIYELCFKPSSELYIISTCFFNETEVRFKNGDFFVLTEFSIPNYSEGLEKTFSNGLTLNEVYRLYMTERFGDAYLEEFAHNATNIDQYRKAYEDAKKDLAKAEKIAKETIDNYKALQELGVFNELTQNQEITR